MPSVMFAAVSRPREGRAQIAPTDPTPQSKLMNVLLCDLGQYRVYRSRFLNSVTQH